MFRAADRTAKGDTSNVILEGMRGVCNRRGDAVAILVFRLVSTTIRGMSFLRLPGTVCGRHDLTGSFVNDDSVSGWDILTVVVMIRGSNTAVGS